MFLESGRTIPYQTAAITSTTKPMKSSATKYGKLLSDSNKSDAKMIAITDRIM
jgi:uncharacterized protein YukE